MKGRGLHFSVYLFFLISPFTLSNKAQAEPLLSGAMTHVSRYCSAILSSFKTKDPIVVEKLRSLSSKLMNIESRNIAVTARYRKRIDVLSAKRRAAREAGDFVTEKKLAERMKKTVVLHLRRTKAFERAKSEVNTEIQQLTGDQNALKESLSNRDYEKAVDKGIRD